MYYNHLYCYNKHELSQTIDTQPCSASKESHNKINTVDTATEFHVCVVVY